jgi:hypothetical protein
MFNLVQVQSELQGTPLPDVMKYANGSNPQVPAYLALSELQRRKQLEDTSTAFYGQQPTIKQQIESGLTSLPQGQVNPTQAPAMTDPTALPPQLAPTPVAPNKGMATAAPAGMVDPTAAPKMMADGGLATLPVPQMFNQSSYVNGGIVHFADPNDATVGAQAIDQLGSQLDATKARLNSLRPPGLASRTDPSVLEKYNAERIGLQQEYDDINNKYQNAIESAGLNRPAQGQLNKNLRLMPVANPMVQQLINEPAKALSSVDKVAEEKIDKTTPEKTETKVKPDKVPSNPNQQASNTGSAKLPPPPAVSALGGEFESNIDMGDAGKIQTPDEVFAQQQRIRALTGVSSDPLKDIKDRYAKLEEKRAKQESQDPYDSLMHRLAAFSQAKATEGFGAQMGASAESGAKFDKEQQALRDKQATEMNALQLGIAKEDDARKRGDAKGIEEAIAAQKKAKMDLYKLQNEEKSAAAVYMNAQTNVQELPIKEKNASANMIQALASRTHAGRLTELEARMKLLKDDPATYAKMYPDVKENPLVTQAAKHYFENPYDPEIKKYATLDEYLVSKGLSSRGGSSGSKIMTMADVKTTAERSGRSEQEVMNAARAKGYTIQ